MVLLGAQSVISNYVAGRGQAPRVVSAWLSAAVLGIGLDLIVIPLAGIVGAAVVSSLSYLVVLGMHVRALRDLRPARPAALTEGRS
jgi:O-antigen/teichoic acid export membrane protein